MRLERRHALWLPIGLLHALLLLAYLPKPPAATAPRGRSVVVQLLPAPRPGARVPKAQPVAPPARARSPATPALRPPVEAQAPQSPTGNSPSSPLPTAEPALPGPAPLPLLQTDATRQAIRLAARAPLLSERAASATDAPARETAQQRLGREVAQTAHGNCLKGEFPSIGKGLLALPAYLIAEASGRCQK